MRFKPDLQIILRTLFLLANRMAKEDYRKVFTAKELELMGAYTSNGESLPNDVTHKEYMKLVLKDLKKLLKRKSSKDIVDRLSAKRIEECIASAWEFVQDMCEQNEESAGDSSDNKEEEDDDVADDVADDDKVADDVSDDDKDVVKKTVTDDNDYVPDASDNASDEDEESDDESDEKEGHPADHVDNDAAATALLACVRAIV